MQRRSFAAGGEGGLISIPSCELEMNVRDAEVRCLRRRPALGLLRALAVHCGAPFQRQCTSPESRTTLRLKNVICRASPKLQDLLLEVKVDDLGNVAERTRACQCMLANGRIANKYQENAGHAPSCPHSSQQRFRGGGPYLVMKR